MSTNIKGVFAHLDCLLTGIDRLEKAGYDNMIVASPLPRHEIEEIMYKGKPSPVRWWTLIGGVIGGITGFALSSLTALDWPMAIPGGKPLVAIPPYIILVFECTILFAGIATLLAMLYHCRIPTNSMEVEICDPRFSDDHFGLVLKNVDPARQAEASRILEGAGAIEVTPAPPGTAPAAPVVPPAGKEETEDVG
jgi:hypothetical protein